ncbi:MAG TPA: amidohydrolase family protein [Planctomycetota bacterium]|nr:amidohydrolase family protein [Planctomycetota bacterium]
MKAWPLLLLAIGAVALPQEGNAPITVIRAGRIHPVSGPPIDHGLIVIRGGKIVDVRAGGEIPRGATLVEADNEVVIPGLVDAQTSVNDSNRDAEESIAPDVRAIDGYDFYASNWRQLSAGVTAAYLSPGSRRLLSGQGAIVKTAGRSPEVRTLVARLGVRVTLGEQSKNPPALYTPPVPASADHPIRPARRQYPASRMGEFAALRRAGIKQSPLFIQAHNEDDLVKALLFAEEAGAKLVLIDAEESPLVADLLAERKIPVLYNAAYAPGRRDAGDASRPGLEATGTLEGAAALAKAGVRFALIAPDDGAMRDLLFLAAAAVRSGLPEKDALASVTLSPAEILGVGDRLGSLARGRDADLVFLSADPFAPGASVRRVMVNGEVVFERKEADVQTYRALRDSSGKARDLLAIKGGRILSVTQGVLPDGLVFLEGGKITYVGRGRPIPPNARTIDATGLTVVPGFIDCGSHLGFHLDRTDAGLRRARSSGIPGTTVIAPSQLIQPDDPAFRAVAAAGVTSVVLTPETSGVCSVIKLGGKAVVARDVAALKFSAQGGTGGYQALKDQLAAGRKYHDDWDAYERNKREPVSARDPISGTWKGALESPEQPSKMDFILELKLDAATNKVSGTLQAPASGGTPEAVEGSFDQGDLKLEQTKPAKVEFVLKVQGPDHLKGTWASPLRKGTLECRREPLPVASKPEAKEPKKDEALEPYRKLFTKEIPAIVVARDLAAVENAVKAFRQDHGLELILAGAEDAALAGDAAFARGASLALGPEFLRDRRGAKINAAEVLAAQGVTVSFATGGATASAQLPLLAAYAVRNGLEPFDALKALTVNPARMLKLDARLGSVERGRDADLVLFTGDPFAPSSRVKLVIVDGKIVYEAP